MSWRAFCPKITKGKEHRAWSQISLNSFPCCLVYYLCYPGHLTSFHWSLMHSCKMSICIAYPRSIKLHCGDKHCPNRNGSQRQRSTSCLGCRSFWGQLQLWPHFPSSGGTKDLPFWPVFFSRQRENADARIMRGLLQSLLEWLVDHSHWPLNSPEEVSYPSLMRVG